MQFVKRQLNMRMKMDASSSQPKQRFRLVIFHVIFFLAQIENNSFEFDYGFY